MKKSAYLRFFVTLFIIFAMLSPSAVLAMGDGKKYFKEGMKHEYAKEWDKAAEQFALAVVDNPKNPEYQLHYIRALFNASQMYMQKGTAQADKGDFAGAYISFRKAYAYDPVNELAKSEMERMVRLQRGLEEGNDGDSTGDVKLVQTKYKGIVLPDDVIVPQRLEKLRDVPFPSGVDLRYLISELAKDLDLNVLFHEESFRSNPKIKIELKGVTAAKALDYIFLQEGLFFQKVGPRTILVANQQQRQRFQQLVLRTFYLSNAAPKDVANVVKTAIPAQPGRTPTIVLTDDATNSVTIRDTSENVELIGRLIKSLDKDRAEVVMEVAIYEVSKTDLLQLGNQVGSEAGLTNLGGTTRGVVGIGGNDTFGGAAGSTVASIIPRAFGVGVVIPAVNLVAFQKKDNTKIIASTQIHAFNNEDSSARIGQRVPVRTAAISSGFNNNGGTNTGDGFVSNVFNYEQTGLTLKFKPLVFPNKDVQVAMEIESKEVFSGGETPTFTERTIKGTARIQNNKTLLLASVAQNIESEGRQGLPLLGLIPIIGRLFTAPKKDNRATDIVIAITPRVIRAPAILPEDEEERETGSLATPTSGSLEAMIIQEEIEEQLAAARRLSNNAKVQLPDQNDEPTYVRSNNLPKTDATSQNVVEKKAETSAQTTVVVKETKKPIVENQVAKVETKVSEPPVQTYTNDKPEQTVEVKQPQKTILDKIQPIDTSVRTLDIIPTSDNSSDEGLTAESLISSRKTSFLSDRTINAGYIPNNSPTAELQLLPGVRQMKAGEKTRIAVVVKSGDQFRSAVLGLRFDKRKLAVRSVGLGDVFGTNLIYQKAIPFFNEDGKMFVTLSTAKDVSENSTGVLAYIEIEALADGKHEITFDQEIMNFLTSNGKNFALKF